MSASLRKCAARRGRAIAYRLVAFAALFASSIAVALAAPAAAPSPMIEVWGVSSGDALEIDGAAIPARGGTLPRVFAGEPFSAGAAAVKEIAAGKHALTLHRAGCAPRVLEVDAEGSYKRSVVIAPAASERCSIPALAPAQKP